MQDQETKDIEDIIINTKINNDTIFKDLEKLKQDGDITEIHEETIQTLQNNQKLVEKLEQQKQSNVFNLREYIDKQVWPGVELAIWEFAGQASIVIGLQYTSAVVCSLIGSESQQLLTPLFGTFLGEVTNLFTWFCCTLGLELSFWEFAGTATRGIGTLYTTAVVVSLIGSESQQLLTPLFGTFLGEITSLFTWFCCLLGMLGGGFIAADSLQLDQIFSGASQQQLFGDSCALAAALFFAIGNVRIGQRARESESFQLSAVRSIFVAIFSVIMVIFYPGSSFQSFLFQIAHCKTTLLGWGCIIWNGLVANAIALTLQLTGQRAVTAGQAQAIYSTVPLFGTLMAWGLLGEKFLGPYGKIGSVAVLGASLLPLIKLFYSGEQNVTTVVEQEQQEKKES